MELQKKIIDFLPSSAFQEYKYGEKINRVSLLLRIPVFQAKPRTKEKYGMNAINKVLKQHYLEMKFKQSFSVIWSGISPLYFTSELGSLKNCSIPFNETTHIV